MSMRWSVLVMLLSMLVVADAGAQATTAKVGSEVQAELATRERVRVMVMFALDPAAHRAPDVLRTAEINATREALLSSARSARGGALELRRTFATVPGFAAEVDAAALQALAADPRVLRIDIDAGGSGHVAEAGALSRVPEVFALGINGAGGKVAVIDSGIDTDHPDFAGRIVDQQCFCSGGGGCCPNGQPTQSGTGAAEDDHSHGTNVTGVLASAGVVSSRGAAPAADIVSVKVLDANNSFCCSSDVVAALDWVRVNHPDASVVNASLGTGALFPGVCDTAATYTQAMAMAVNALVANGTQVFVSSGNQNSPNSIAAPACVASATAVGAVYDAPLGDIYFGFFGCGDDATVADLPTCFTNSNTVVDLYAPGALVTSSGPGGGLTTYAGTSQATPLAAGCAAALRAAFPSVTAAEVEAALKASPVRVVDPKNGLEFARLDCLDALRRVDPGFVFKDGFESP